MTEEPSPEQLEPEHVGPILEDYRDRLRRLVEVRLDPRLRNRIDTSDVIQDALVEVAERLPEYRAAPEMPFFLWVRFLTAQKVLQLHRRHLGAQMRDAHKEVHLASGSFPEASSVTLASALAASGILSPSGEALRQEQADTLHQALGQLKDVDREILVLRHFEHLSNVEAARVLGLSEPGASLRHLRAVQRLRDALRNLGLPDSSSH